MDFRELLLPPGSTIREALARIDRGGRQFVLVLDKERLVGLVTDGDIRRGLIRGVDLDDPVDTVLNRAPITVGTDAVQEDIDRLKSEKGVRDIPVVDSNGRLVDVVGERERVGTALSTSMVLMAGGRGQRLYPLTKDLPKPLVPVGGTPMIEVILRRLHAQGFRRVYISVNYLGHMIEEHLQDGRHLGLEISYLYESTPLGTAGALAQLRGELDEPFAVMNADLLTDVDLRRMLAFHRKVGGHATVGVREYAYEVPFGVVQAQGDIVHGLAEKPRREELVSAGIYVLDPRALELLERDAYCDMPSLLTRIMETDASVGAFRIDEDWIDVGRPEDLARARAVVERQSR